MLPDKSKLNGLLDDEIILPKPKAKRKSKFDRLLADESFDEFSHIEWIKYFSYLAAQGEYIVKPFDKMKENSIVKALMKKYKPEIIKLMMEFIWEAPHNLKDKNEIGLWILSGNWLNTIYPSAIKWGRGESFSKQTKGEANRFEGEHKTKEKKKGTTIKFGG
jgi:hypothetical protein